MTPLAIARWLSVAIAGLVFLAVAGFVVGANYGNNLLDSVARFGYALVVRS